MKYLSMILRYAYIILPVVPITSLFTDSYLITILISALAFVIVYVIPNYENPKLCVLLLAGIIVSFVEGNIIFGSILIIMLAVEIAWFVHVVKTLQK